MISRLILFLTAYLAMAVSSFETGRVRMEPSINIFSSKRWIKLTQPPAGDAKVVAIFALKRDSETLKKFETNLLDLSTPSSPKYGKWLTKNEAITMIAPSDDQLKVITDFIYSYGVSDVTVSEFKVLGSPILIYHY